MLKGTGDYSLYGDYGQSNYGTLDGAENIEPMPIEIPPEAIDQVESLSLLESNDEAF